MIVPGSKSSNLRSFLLTGPPHARKRDNLADLPVGTVLRVKDHRRQLTVFPSRGSRNLHNPKVFLHRPASTSPTSQKKQRSIDQNYSRFPSATGPRSSVSRERCIDIWFHKTVPRSLPSRSAYIPPYHQTRHPFSITRPGLRSRQILWRHHPTLFLRELLLLAGASDESVADTGFLLPIPPPWPQVLFSFRQLVIVPVTSKRQEDHTNITPSQQHQTTGTRSGETYLFCHPRLPATFTASLRSLLSTGYSSG